MKRNFIRRIGLLLLCFMCVCPVGAGAMPMIFTLDDVYVEGLATVNLSTRSGPSTAYRDTGTYKVKGKWIHILSYAFDDHGVCWVQCDIPYGEEYRRVYTGLKRFDATTVDLESLPQEDPLTFETVTVLETAKALYGPGLGYGMYDKLTVDQHQKVLLVAMMDDFALVEWKTAKQSYRAWIFAGVLENVPAVAPAAG